MSTRNDTGASDDINHGSILGSEERPNIDVQRVTFNDGEVDQRALGVNRVKIFERWKAIDTRDKRKNSRR